MEPTTKTIAYTLSVPAQQGHTAAYLADTLADLARTTPSVTLTGSHVDAAAGAVRFRTEDDARAIAFATYVTEECGTVLTGAVLASGFGVNRRVVARS